MQRIKVVYIISDIDKALAFEWIAAKTDKEQFELSFVLLNPGDTELERFLKTQRVNVLRITCRSKRDWPKAWWSLLRHFKTTKPDIVHCHLIQANILGLSAAYIAGVRQRIYTRHHSDYHFRYFPKGVKWDQWCNRLATKIIAPSNAVRNVLTGMEHVPEAKIALVPHGFDLSYFRDVPPGIADKVSAQYNPNGKYPVVGVISRFTELKGIQYIIPAFQRLLQQYPDALLLLFNANGDYKQPIESLLQELPAASYKTVSFEKELAAVYTLFDVFVQVSTDTNIEAFGQTYIEALAAKVPSVFTLAGVAPDFIRHRENAIVVPFKDSDAIYRGIEAILSDEVLRNKIIDGGWNSVRERFSLQEMISHLSNLYTN